eukprot:14033713-Alexandrium_andersonii.AAC.1
MRTKLDHTDAVLHPRPRAEAGRPAHCPPPPRAKGPERAKDAPAGAGGSQSRPTAPSHAAPEA